MRRGEKKLRFYSDQHLIQSLSMLGVMRLKLPHTVGVLGFLKVRTKGSEILA